MDAWVILNDARRMPFVAWQFPSEHVLQRQALLRRVAPLTQAIIRQRNHAQGYPIGNTCLIARDEQCLLRLRQIRQIRDILRPPSRFFIFL